MQIQADNLGKRYFRRWIFRELGATIPYQVILGVTGPNGSGKSTLLKVLSGALPASSGTLRYYARDGREIESSSIFRHIAYVAPYVDLIEEMTLQEALRYHRHFRAFREDYDEPFIYERLGKAFKPGLRINEMSSGMKQRVRLILAFATRAEVLFLDEPTSNLDEEGKDWFQSLVDERAGNATLIIASNDRGDLKSCTRFLHVPDFSS